MAVVVEAAENSGALVVAERAAEVGHLVGAVPGPITSRCSAGTNSLLAGGASVVRSSQDVLDALDADEDD
jgi:DNA processing protein